METDLSTPVFSSPDQAGVAPASPPREFTPAIRRAVWTEPRVRRWWLLTIVIFLIFAGYTVSRVMERQDEVRLIRDGLAVPTTVVGVLGVAKGQPTHTDDYAQLLMKLPTGNEQVAGTLVNPSIVGSDITLHVDPRDHSHWTDRREATPLIDSLFVGLIVSPLIPLLFLLAYFKMRSAQNVWIDGLQLLAVVFDKKQSPIAPLSDALQCSLQDGTDKQLFTVFVPKAGKGFSKGDLLWVIMPANKGSPLAALWMTKRSAQA